MSGISTRRSFRTWRNGTRRRFCRGRRRWGGTSPWFCGSGLSSRDAGRPIFEGTRVPLVDWRTASCSKQDEGYEMTLQHILPLWFFPWCERSLIGRMIQQSRWSFAIIETIHIMALAVLLGSFLIVDLRLFGLGMRQQSVAEVAKQFGKWSWVAFAVMVSTGIP